MLAFPRLESFKAAGAGKAVRTRGANAFWQTKRWVKRAGLDSIAQVVSP